MGIALAGAGDAHAQSRDHRTKTACTQTFNPAVRFAGNLASLTPVCRMEALKINAKLAQAADKANDDDDDDDDAKATATADNIETQKQAADAAHKAAWQDLLEARVALGKANAQARKAAEDDVREAEEEYNKRLDEAGGLAKQISDRSQKALRASIGRQQDGIRKLQDKLKAAVGAEKLKVEQDLVEEQQDAAQKEEMLAKSELLEALHQFRFTSRRVGAEAKVAALHAAAEARLDAAKAAYEKAESRVKSTVDSLKARASQVEGELKKLGQTYKGAVKHVKATAASIKKKYKDLTKDVKGAVSKAKGQVASVKKAVNQVKNTVNEAKDALEDLFDF